VCVRGVGACVCVGGGGDSTEAGSVVSTAKASLPIKFKVATDRARRRGWGKGGLTCPMALLN
jgi:hypothetical protein